MMMKQALKALVGSLILISLAGCITLLPKTKPADLYRFGYQSDGTSAKIPATNLVTIQRTSLGFTRAAAGDGLLTSTGSETAYIAGARWVSPAGTLMDEALTRSFATHGDGVRLAQRGEMTASDVLLRLDVRRFEVHYTKPGADPKVQVTIAASLVHATDRSVFAETVIEASVPVRQNRVHEIVDAFNVAVSEVMLKLTQWTSTQVKTDQAAH